MSRRESFPPNREDEGLERGAQDDKLISRRKFLGFLGVGAGMLAASRAGASLIETTINPEFTAETEEAVQAAIEAARSLAPILEAVYEPRAEIEISSEVWGRIDRIFSGPLEPLRDWNRETAADGRYAHLVAYMVQDFRNSSAANYLNNLYESVSAEERRSLQKKLRNVIGGDPVLYSLMFEAGRPAVFDPRANPDFKTENISPKQPFRNYEQDITRDSAGRTVFSGNDYRNLKNDGPLSNELEASSYFIRKPAGDGEALLAAVTYWGNVMPAWQFYRTRNNFDYFKTYLSRNKGEYCLFYAVHVENGPSQETRTPLTLEQVTELKRFFKWEREES